MSGLALSDRRFGETLARRLGRGALGIDETLAIAISLCEELAELHSRGALLGDVRPAKVLLAEQPEGMPLASFDREQASATRLDSASARDQVRNARYLAPERAGLIDRPIDERSDLYAVGVLTYECLSGRPPFDSETAGELLRQHLSVPATSLRRYEAAEIPRALDEIVQRLLRKDPDDRYQSAAAVLADLTALREGREEGAETRVVIGARDLRQTLTEPILAGRRREIAILEHHLAEARKGNGRLVRIEAESGGGKSRLLDEFCRLQGADDVLVLRAQGMDRVAPSSLQVLIDLVDGAGSMPAEDAARRRGVRDVVARLDALGSPGRAALVVLDDCQWIDELSARVLATWAQKSADAKRAPRHVLVVTASRGGEEVSRQPLAALRGVPRLELAPLEAAAVHEMVVSMAGPTDPAAVELVAELSRGNPFMVSAVLRGLIESGALTAAEQGWLLDPAASGFQASGEVAGLLARRLELLDDLTHDLLAAGAVLGRSFEIATAAVLSGQSRVEAAEAIEQALQRRLVWHEAPGRYAIVHDRLREVILEQLGPFTLTHLHRRAGEVIEAADRSRALELAYHFDAAGQPARALPYALAAGEAARSRSDFELAERQYRIAERGLGGDSPDRGRVAAALGEVLMVRGAYDEARARFELARAVAGDDVSVARIEGTLAEIAFRRDEVADAFEHVSTALRTLRCPVPARRWSLLPLAVWESLRGLATPAWWRRYRGRRREDLDRRLLIADLYIRLVYCTWYSAGGTRRVLWSVARHINSAERCPPSSQLAQAHAVYAASLAAVFPVAWKQALRHVEKAEDLHRQLDDHWALGQTLRMRAAVLSSVGRYPESKQAADRAMAILRRAGDRWNLNSAAGQRALCVYRMGDRRATVKQVREIHQRAVEVGDAQAEAAALDIWARATSGRVPGEFIEAARERAGDNLYTRGSLLLASALHARAAGRLEDGVAALEEADSMMSRSGTYNRWTAPILPWLATFTREAAEAAPPVPRARRALLRRARRASRRALRFARLYRAELPHALRESAMVAVLAGRDRRARRHFARSIELAETQGALVEVDETRRMAAAMAAAAGWAEPPRGAPAPRREEPGAGPGEEATIGLADRFAALLLAGQRLVSAGSSEEIAAAVREAATTLLRPEECHVFGIVAGEEGTDEDADSALRRALVARASERRRAVILAPATPDGDDAPEAGVRSALCAPILVGEEVRGHFLAVHSLVGNLFGEEERQLAEFISRLAGSALDRERLQQGRRSEVVSAQEAERSRIARDLHDEIGQAITSILLDARSIENYVGGADWDPAQLRSRLKGLRGVGVAALDEVQRLASELRPAVLDDIGLVAAVRRLADDAGTRHGIRIEIASGSLGSGDRLSTAAETTAYRVAQEAVTNVMRHSNATRCSLVLARVDERLRLVVADDGTGFDATAATAAGLGLRGMRERAALAEGTLAVRSSPGDGTTVVLEVPVE